MCTNHQAARRRANATGFVTKPAGRVRIIPVGRVRIVPIGRVRIIPIGSRCGRLNQIYGLCRKAA